MPIKRAMASGSATDVPPNFITTPTRNLPPSLAPTLASFGVASLPPGPRDRLDLRDSEGRAFS
jgi:hypothetical protein